jgi:hypothetical protein
MVLVSITLYSIAVHIVKRRNLLDYQFWELLMCINTYIFFFNIDILIWYSDNETLKVILNPRIGYKGKYAGQQHVPLAKSASKTVPIVEDVFGSQVNFHGH